MGVKQLAAAERNDLADFLETLTPEQWQSPSLCTDWTVRDVAAHIVSYEGLGPRQLAERMIRGGLKVSGSHNEGINELADRSTDDIVELLRRYAVPRGLTAGFGGAIALTDTTIHHQDIRRPLGIPREIPAERLIAILDFLPRALALPAPRNLRGLRVVATDIDWAYGNGPEISGPAESLILALAGRPVALDDLRGPGLATLENRVRH